MEYSDFLGNDLFLIVETHEELINSLNGHYAQLMFQLQKKGEENTLKFFVPPAVLLGVVIILIFLEMHLTQLTIKVIKKRRSLLSMITIKKNILKK